MDDPVETDKGSRKPVDGVTRSKAAFEGVNSKSPLPKRSVGIRLVAGLFSVQAVDDIVCCWSVTGFAVVLTGSIRRIFLREIEMNTLSQSSEWCLYEGGVPDVLDSISSLTPWMLAR